MKIDPDWDKYSMSELERIIRCAFEAYNRRSPSLGHAMVDYLLEFQLIMGDRDASSLVREFFDGCLGRVGSTVSAVSEADDPSEQGC